ncbi:hypothetical protein CR513_35837, partial [Mucuna pruriens]
MLAPSMKKAYGASDVADARYSTGQQTNITGLINNTGGLTSSFSKLHRSLVLILVCCWLMHRVTVLRVREYAYNT